jgi:lipopolysaccharide transport system ATP-binding protein
VTAVDLDREAQQAQSPAPAEIAIRVEGLGKRYLLDGGKHSAGALLSAKVREDQAFWALENVSFTVAEGERVGIIGRNGAGKSTLLKLLSRVIAPSAGRAEIRGRVASLLEVGTGFNPHLPGRENIYLNAALLGLSRKQTDERLEEIIAFAELGRFIDEPIRVYSTGMRARLGFAIAAHIDPDVLMLDEVLSVGDAAFQAKCLQRVGEMMSTNPTLLFVSHSFAAVRQFCDRCIWIERGSVAMDGPVDDVVKAYTDQVMSLKASAKFEAPQSRGVSGPLKAARPDFEPRARLLAARVLDTEGRESAHIDVNADFNVEVDYQILSGEAVVLPGLRFYTEDGQLIFTAVCSEPEAGEWRRYAGIYRSRVHVPAHLMNLGMHRISIGLNTPHAGGLMRHHVVEDALTFWTHEARFGEESARGPYTAVKGAVRPLFLWTHQQLTDLF